MSVSKSNNYTSSDQSRLASLDKFSKAIKLTKGRTLAFNSLHQEDKKRILKSLSFSQFDWNKIQAKGLKGRVQKEIGNIQQGLKKELSSTKFKSVEKSPSVSAKILKNSIPSKTKQEKAPSKTSSYPKKERTKPFIASTLNKQAEASVPASALSSSSAIYKATLSLPKSEGTPIEATAELLTEQFLTAKKTVSQYSGYRIRLKIRDPQSFAFEILPRGEKNKPFKVPKLSTVFQCKCCNSGFEHTFINKPNKHCIDLTKKIADEGMLAVCSPAKILLIVPRVSKDGIQVEGYRHIFELDKDKLKKVFAAAIKSLHFIYELYPAYKPHVEWHVGARSSVGLLHTRFHNLPSSFFKGLSTP